MHQSVYYKSPLGILQITCTGNAVSQVSFVNRKGAEKIKEDMITESNYQCPNLYQFHEGYLGNFEDCMKNCKKYLIAISHWIIHT